MRLLQQPEHLQPGNGRVCLALGFFDGVHLGHQEIIRETLRLARESGDSAVVLTFDRHPSTVLAPNRVPPLIYPLEKKIRTIQSLGADALLLLHFDRALSHEEAGPFIERLAAGFRGIRAICVGTQFVFGHNRGGNVGLLQKLGTTLGYTTHPIPAVELDGTAISSTRIRKAIQTGELERASRMLGQPYSLSGKVVAGDRLGRQLGFPTANLDVAGLALPPNGVYAAEVLVGGSVHPAVLNIGFRPTLQNPAPQLRVEAHLLDFAGDLYNQEIEILFRQKLREERQLPGLDALKAQIATDIQHARTLFPSLFPLPLGEGQGEGSG